MLVIQSAGVALAQLSVYFGSWSSNASETCLGFTKLSVTRCAVKDDSAVSHRWHSPGGLQLGLKQGLCVLFGRRFEVTRLSLLLDFPIEWYNLRKWLHSNLNTHTRFYSTYQCVIHDWINTLNPGGACSMPDRKPTVDLSPDWFTHDPTNRAEGKSVVSTMWCWIKGAGRFSRTLRRRIFAFYGLKMTVEG